MTAIAFIFPGQGSQIVGMGRDFFADFRESRLVFEEASDTTHVDLKKLCFDGPADELTLTENLQPALFTVEAAIMAAIAANIDVKPVVTAGHSLGEYAALYAAGALSVADGARLCRRRGVAMQRAVPVGQGTMAAILGLDAAKVESLCRKAAALQPHECIEPANFNAPGQVVVAGSVDGVAKAIELLKTDPDFQGGKSIPLQVSAPFHCKLMAPAQKELAPLLSATRFERPSTRLIPNVTAHPIDSETSFAGLLIDQIVKPVRWDESMRRLRTLDVTEVVEIGPNRVLAGLMKRIDRDMPVKNVSQVQNLKEVFK